MGVRQREGDKLCQLAQDRLNVTSFPNQQFPRGIMVSHTLDASSDDNTSLILLARFLLQHVWVQAVEGHWGQEAGGHHLLRGETRHASDV